MPLSIMKVINILLVKRILSRRVLVSVFAEVLALVPEMIMVAKAVLVTMLNMTVSTKNKQHQQRNTSFQKCFLIRIIPFSSILGKG